MFNFHFVNGLISGRCALKPSPTRKSAANAHNAVLRGVGWHMARPGWPGVAACDAARPGQGRSGVAGVAGPGPGGWRGKSTAGSSPGPGGPPAQLGQTGATDLRTWKCHSRNSFYDALLANRTKKAKNISGVHSSGETGRRFSPQVQLFVCAVCEGSDNWPSAVLAARAVSLFRARHLRPKLEKSRSWAPGAVIQQRPEGGGEGGPAPRGRRRVRKRSPTAAGTAWASDPAQAGRQRGAGRRRAPTFPAFRGAPLAPGAGSLFLNRSCYLGVVFPIVPDQELLARRDWLRGEKRQAPGQSERRLLAGRGGAPGWGGAPEASRAGRAAPPPRPRAGQRREGTLCWREDLTSWPPPPHGALRWVLGSDRFA